MVLGFGHSGGQWEPGSAPRHPQRCGPGAGGPALAMGCLRVTAPTAGVMGWPVLPWQLADGGLQQGQRGGSHGSTLAELLNNSPFSTDSSALPGQK